MLSEVLSVYIEREYVKLQVVYPVKGDPVPIFNSRISHGDLYKTKIRNLELEGVSTIFQSKEEVEHISQVTVDSKQPLKTTG